MRRGDNSSGELRFSAFPRPALSSPDAFVSEAVIASSTILITF